MKGFYVHGVERKPVDEWHLLEEHLKEAAELADKFAERELNNTIFK